MHFFIRAGKVEAGIGVTLNRSGPKFLGPEKLGPERLGPERQAINFLVHRAQNQASHLSDQNCHI